MKRALVFTAIVTVAMAQMAIAGSLSFYHSGEDAVALFTNETGQAVNCLLLTFSTPVETTNMVGIGANMTLESVRDNKLVFAGDVSPLGVWEVDWALADGTLVAAAWLQDGQVVQEIDVHAPTANITVIGSLIDHPITFSALGSSDPDGKDLTRYTWTWDDGTTAEGYEVSRVFKERGLYKVTLTVVDEDGQSSSRTRVFAVHEPLPEPSVPAGYYLVAFLNIPGNDVVIGDIDNDGQNELVISNEAYTGVDATLSVYEFEHGNYVLSWSDLLPYSTGGLFIGDADNDGQNELLVGASVSSPQGGGGDVRIYKYVGNGNYKKVWSDSINAHIDSGAVYIGDADNDGQNEIAVAVSWYGRQVIVYDHTTGNNYTRTWTTSAGGDAKDVFIGDADNDGKNEILVGWGYSSRGTRMYKFAGGSYNEVWTYDSGYTTRVGIGDVDNDGKNELLSIGESHKSVLQHQGGYIYIEQSILDPSDKDRYDGASIGDTDNDGMPEIVLLRTAPGIEKATILEYANGVYSASWETTFGSGPNLFTRYDNCYVGDSDNNGQNEVVFSTDSGVYIYRYRH